MYSRYQTPVNDKQNLDSNRRWKCGYAKGVNMRSNNQRQQVPLPVIMVGGLHRDMKRNIAMHIAAGNLASILTDLIMVSKRLEVRQQALQLRVDMKHRLYYYMRTRIGYISCVVVFVCSMACLL